MNTSFSMDIMRRICLSLDLPKVNLGGLEPKNTSFAGSTLLSVIDEMNHSSPKAFKITNSFFDCLVYIREENIFWELLKNCSDGCKRFENCCLKMALVHEHNNTDCCLTKHFFTCCHIFVSFSDTKCI